jgi:hypothetical protein
MLKDWIFQRGGKKSAARKGFPGGAFFRNDEAKEKQAVL